MPRAARPPEREAAGGEAPALPPSGSAVDPRPFDRVFSAAFDRPRGEAQGAGSLKSTVIGSQTRTGTPCFVAGR